MSDFSRLEVEQHFERWRAAVDQRDLDGMAALLEPTARGGNSQFGVLDGREAIIEFARKRWPESVPNVSIWHAIDGARVVNKWRETLPGQPPPNRDYHYYGITELIYAGSGQWSFMYGLPDIVGLIRVYSQWKEDGQADINGEIYPGLR